MTTKAGSNAALDKLDQEKSYKTQMIIGLGFFIITTFMFYWLGVKQEGLIAGDMTALALGAAYAVYMDRTKVKFTNRLMAGLIILACIRAFVAISVSGVIA